jgi:hypothetical protein
MSKAVTYTITVPDVATGTVDLAILHGVKVQDCWIIKTGGAGAGGNTIQLQDGSGNAITDVMDNNKADGLITKCASIDDSFAEVFASEGLRVSSVKGGGNAQCLVEVLGIPTLTP